MLRKCFPALLGFLLPTLAVAAVPPLLPFDHTQDLYLLEHATGHVLRIDADRNIEVVLTPDEIIAVTGVSAVTFSHKGLAFDAVGNLYFTESESDNILKLDTSGTLQVLTSEAEIVDVTGGTADPDGLAFNSDGFLYVTDDDPNCDCVLRVDPETGEVTMYVTKADLDALPGITDADIETAIVGSEDATVYTTSDQSPDAVFAIAPGGVPSVLASGLPFGDLDVFLTRDMAGDLILADSDADTIFRLTPQGSLSVLLSEAELEATNGGEVNLQGGMAFDEDSNLYVSETNTDNLLRFDASGVGSIWVGRDAIAAVTGARPDLRGGIAFAHRSILMLAGCGLEPLLAPADPKAPVSPSSAPLSGLFQVDCGAAFDSCDGEPAMLSAELNVRRFDVVDGACSEVEDTIPVACDEILELVVLGAPCPARPPKAPRSALSVTSEGRKIISGQELELHVHATDACAGHASCSYDPLVEGLLSPAPPAACKGPSCDGGL